MKKESWRIVIYYLLIFLFGSFHPGFAKQISVVSKEGQPIHFLIEGENVSLSRSRGVGYIPVFTGSQVQRGDLIFPAQGLTAKILCGDLSLHILGQKAPCPCSNRENIFAYDGYEISRYMGVSSVTPYILYPRRTIILDSTPLLRWRDTGASNYTAQIIDKMGNLIWQDPEVEVNEIKYPGYPKLLPGKKYLLLVRDNDTGDYSGNDPMKGLGFRLLDIKSQKDIENIILKINQLNISNDSKTFATAMYYAMNGINGTALSLLDDIRPRLSTPAVYLWRGHFYGKMLLLIEAEKAYTNALNFAREKGDLYTQAQAADGLWCITGKQTYQDTAMKIYKKLGGVYSQSICENGPITNLKSETDKP